MKVIDGKFGGPEEVPEAPDITLLEAMAEALTQAELADELAGQFVLLVNTANRFTFVTNEASSAEIACLLEVAKNTALQKYSEEM